MAVFTTVTPDQASAWLLRYALGKLVALEGIQSGIENTNYFLTTDAAGRDARTTGGRYVLTLFEKLTATELPFYLGLMAHLADRGVPTPRPMSDVDGRWLGELNGKPAAIVARLSGRSVAAPSEQQCHALGRMLGTMHAAGVDYPHTMPNPRGPHWWSATAPRLAGFLPPDDWRMLENEIAFQASHRFDRLPRGPIHADLFRDNVLFEDGSAEVGGIIDFYFACTDVLLFDVAVAVNDWCRADYGDPSAGIDAHAAAALLQGYAAVRPFGDTERLVWPAMLRAGALRFWVSRLFDFHLPRPGELVHAHDPAHFRDLLSWHVASPGRIALPGA
ncbi:MAG: homoserine kinase [Rhodocyclaceae bacterium]|nr:homoserine kinase [Rhodocyclaceae bacterium]